MNYNHSILILWLFFCIGFPFFFLLPEDMMRMHNNYNMFIREKYAIFDVETNGLLDKATKIHCLVYSVFEDGKLIETRSLIDYESMKKFFSRNIILIGHNIIKYDIPVCEKILGINIQNRLIDTLPLSWYLYPVRMAHGLEVWGEEFGVPKPKIEDWDTLTIEEYVHRCEEDVKINSLLFHKQSDYLGVIYEENSDLISNFVNYLSFKMDCAREQEEVKCKIDRELVINSLQELEKERDEKEKALKEAMPYNIKYKTVTKPTKIYKKDGSISAAGKKWFLLLNREGIRDSNIEELTVIDMKEEGNPASVTQIKDWLFILGWEPINFEFRKNTKGVVNKIPQVYIDSLVCPSIKKLYSIEPALENLEMLSLINHRIGVFNSFLDAMDQDDTVVAKLHGLTNTLRFKHVKPITNLPKVNKFYGDKIRGSIIKPREGYVLCGSDMSSLEDTTKQHYMMFFDPEYVTQMRVPGFEPHLDIGVLAKLMTVEEAEEFKRISKLYNEKRKDPSVVITKEEAENHTNLSIIRGMAKTVNFAGIYGAGPPKIAQTTGMSLSQATTLHKTYWERNKAVKQVARNAKVKTIKYIEKEKFTEEVYIPEEGIFMPVVKTRDIEVEQKWLYNPISGFWYSLRYEKDRFSTLNQGSAVYCFDLWVREVRKRGIKIMLQYHDEIAFSLPKDKTVLAEKLLRESIKSVNDSLKLNVPLDISVDFGNTYAEIH